MRGIADVAVQVVARFNENVTRLLLAGALEAFERHGVSEVNVKVPSLSFSPHGGCDEVAAFIAVCCFQVVWVPGCFEIPIVAQEMAKSGEFHAVLCIGAVVSGLVAYWPSGLGV